MNLIEQRLLELRQEYTSAINEVDKALPVVQELKSSCIGY